MADIILRVEKTTSGIDFNMLVEESTYASENQLAYEIADVITKALKKHLDKKIGLVMKKFDDKKRIIKKLRVVN